MAKVVLKLSRMEWDDLLNCVTITLREYSGRQESPNFMKAVEKLRLKMWREMRKQKMIPKGSERG